MAAIEFLLLSALCGICRLPVATDERDINSANFCRRKTKAVKVGLSLISITKATLQSFYSELQQRTPIIYIARPVFGVTFLFERRLSAMCLWWACCGADGKEWIFISASKIDWNSHRFLSLFEKFALNFNEDSRRELLKSLTIMFISAYWPVGIRVQSFCVGGRTLCNDEKQVGAAAIIALK